VVDIVTLEDSVWNHPPHKEEAGSPNVVGGVALAEAITILKRVGMRAVAEHELHLLQYAYRKLKRMHGIVLYGPTENLEEKVGVIAFNIEGMHHAKAAAIMGIEGGIGVRNGCFCAHPYVKKLLGITPEEDRRWTAAVLAGDKSEMPGMVRASLGCYNDESDIDALAEMIERIVRNEYKGHYVQNKSTGAYHVEGFTPDFRKYFTFAESLTPADERTHSEAS